MESRKWRKEGLPKREPSWSAGGLESIAASMLSSIERSFEIVESEERLETEEIFLSAADSEREKINERIRL